MRDLLSTIFPGIEIVSHNPKFSYRIRNAGIVSLPTPGAYLRTEIQDEFTELANRFNKSSGLPEKIYVSRRRQSIKRPAFRVLESETILFEKLHTQGYVEIFPEEYSIDRQIEIFSNARIIVGIGGSNMFGCCFARKAEIIIDIESTDHWLYAHANIMASSGCPFSIIMGNKLDVAAGAHGNWEIDVPAVMSGLKTLGVA